MVPDASPGSAPLRRFSGHKKTPNFYWYQYNALWQRNMPVLTCTIPLLCVGMPRPRGGLSVILYGLGSAPWALDERAVGKASSQPANYTQRWLVMRSW